MKLSQLKPDMILWDCHKYPLGNSRQKSWGNWPVRVISVHEISTHEDHAVVSWNGNPAERWYTRDVAKLRKEKTVLIKVGVFGMMRKETRDEKKERLRAASAPKVATIPDRRVDSFHVGQRWQSPKGKVYQVRHVARGGLARLDAWPKGRTSQRAWDAVANLVLVFDPEYPHA